LVLEKLPLLLLSAASSAVTLAAQRTVIEHSQNMTLPVRIVNALYAYCLYIVQAFWPSGLTAFYPYQGARLTAWRILLCVLFLAGVTAWVWRARSRPYLAVGWFWFLGTLVPTLGLVQVGDQAMADRYAYLPMIGIFVMVVWGIADWAEKRSFSSRWRIAVAGLVLAVFALLTWRQIGFWRTSSDLWSHALQVTRDNYVAEDYAGSALLARYSEAGGQHYLDEALVHFQNAVRFNPRDIAGHLNLGVDLHQHGRWQEAIEQYKQVLALNPNSEIVIKTLTDLGAAYQQLGDYTASQRYYREALKMDPHNQTVLMNLGKLGMLARMQQLADAAAAHPSPQAYLQLGQLQEITGKTGAARASFEEALRLDPAMAEARGELDRMRARSASAAR